MGEKNFPYLYRTYMMKSDNLSIPYNEWSETLYEYFQFGRNLPLVYSTISLAQFIFILNYV